jgi:peptidoglycan/xylan/chitin deacetylase (PgdA/CDA1 family)
MPGLARKSIKLASLATGLSGARREGDVHVLIYHRVAAHGREVDVSPKAFEQHLAFLSESAPPVALDAALDGKGSGLVVTFDDGYRDFYEVVLPLLVEYRVPAILYLATGLVANGARRDPDGLTWAQLAEAVSSGYVDIGAHTHTHPNLAEATGREAEEEMRRSRGLIEEHLQRRCSHFAYPFGISSNGADRAARKLFATAALGDWRINRRNELDPYRLGRTPVMRGDGPLFFRSKVKGRLRHEALAYRLLGRGPWKT